MSLLERVKMLVVNIIEHTLEAYRGVRSVFGVHDRLSNSLPAITGLPTITNPLVTVLVNWPFGSVYKVKVRGIFLLCQQLILELDRAPA